MILQQFKVPSRDIKTLHPHLITKTSGGEILLLQSFKNSFPRDENIVSLSSGCWENSPEYSSGKSQSESVWWSHLMKIQIVFMDHILFGFL